MNGKTFSYRVALLLALMLIASLVDFYRHGNKATKFGEYGFVLLTGSLGAIFGCVNDIITSRISPDYFIWGKGLEEGSNLQMQAGLFGLRVGFSAGVIGGAFCLYAARRKSAHPPAKILCLLQLLWLPLVGAILCGIVLPLAFSNFDPAGFSSQLGALLSPDRIARFREVWWTHVGVYAGMVVGLATMIRFAVKERKRQGATNSGACRT